MPEIPAPSAHSARKRGRFVLPLWTVFHVFQALIHKDIPARPRADSAAGKKSLAFRLLRPKLHPDAAHKIAARERIVMETRINGAAFAHAIGLHHGGAKSLAGAQ